MIEMNLPWMMPGLDRRSKESQNAVVEYDIEWTYM